MEVVGLGIMIRQTLLDLSKNMAAKPVPTPLEFWFGRSEYVLEPKGVVLVVAPWNYPIVVALDGVATALAAGNAVVLKPSEVSVHSERLMLQTLGTYLDEECFHIVHGDARFTQDLISGNKFEHICLTGRTG